MVRRGDNRPLVKSLDRGLERDSKQVPVEKAGAVTPGEVVNFTMSSVNEGSAPALEYRAVGQIPKSAIFVVGSALGDGTRVTYSIDEGQKFSATPMIDEKQPDGTIKKVAARWMYTQCASNGLILSQRRQKSGLLPASALSSLLKISGRLNS